MAVGIDDIIFAVCLAVGGLIAETATSKSEAERADRRAARETQVRQIYQTAKDRFNVSYDELSQYLNKLDIDLSRLSEATRGSARLSDASKKLRQALKDYPNVVNKVNVVKNEISKSINRLSELESDKARRIQSRKSVDNIEILGDIQPEIQGINTMLSSINEKGQKISSNREDINKIDTTLEVKEDKTKGDNVPKDNSYYDATGINPNYTGEWKPGAFD